MKNSDRRSFIKKTSLSAASLAAGSLLPSFANAESLRPADAKYMGGFAAPKIANLRAAFIGVGKRGGVHLEFLAGLEGTEVVAISDLYEDNVKKWVKVAKKA